MDGDQAIPELHRMLEHNNLVSEGRIAAVSPDCHCFDLLPIGGVVFGGIVLVVLLIVLVLLLKRREPNNLTITGTSMKVSNSNANKDSPSGAYPQDVTDTNSNPYPDMPSYENIPESVRLALATKLNQTNSISGADYLTNLGVDSEDMAYLEGAVGVGCEGMVLYENEGVGLGREVVAEEDADSNIEPNGPLDADSNNATQPQYDEVYNKMHR